MKLSRIISRLEGQHQNLKLILNGKDSNIETLLTDSRNLFAPSSSLFFAINPPRGNDGHKFLNALYDAGVRNFAVEYIPDNFKGLKDSNLIVTSDSVRLLSDIGALNRDNSKKIIAIVGSRGKTTVKELAFQMMEPLKKISRSPRSYNSKIGVPLSLWQIKPDTEIALIEAGISRVGEMENLSRIIDPDVVVFTNIGAPHAEGFKNKEEKAREKVIMAAAPNVKTIIYPADDSLIAEALSGFEGKKNLISWSIKDPAASLFIELGETDGSGKTELSYVRNKQKGKFKVLLNKFYDLENIASVLALMLEEGFTETLISERFSELSHIDTRLNVSEGLNGCSVILDSYTSDLSSLLPAIEFMRRRRMPGQNLSLIMSDPAHETDNLESTYHAVADMLAQSGVTRFIGIGQTVSGFARLFPPSSRFYRNVAEFIEDFNISDFENEIILLKGSPRHNFPEIFSLLEAKKHETVLEVNLDAMIRNYNYFRHHVPSSTGIIAMVKAFGYGVGSYEIAKTLQDCGAAYLAVAVIDEAIDLRRKGITMPIMIMNPRSVNYRALFHYRLEPVVYSMQMLKELIGQARINGEKNYPVHIKLDTGMHRMGFLPEELKEVGKMLCSSDNLRAETVFSHLATADCLDMDEFTLRQLNLFEEMSETLIRETGYNVKRHILNSAGIIRFPEYHYDFVRLGIGLYGANTLPPEVEKPLSVVASLKSVIICIRELKKGEAVGYGRKGSVEKTARIATVPIGYADGIDRRFGNGNLSVMINGHCAPTIGNICMDATMIDVTDIDCREGDSVEIFGTNIPLDTLASTLDTIPYEILTSVSPRVKRIYYRE